MKSSKSYLKPPEPGGKHEALIPRRGKSAAWPGKSHTVKTWTPRSTRGAMPLGSNPRKARPDW